MIDLLFVTFVICGFFKITHNCKIPYNMSLASLLKHGLYKAADKIANRKNIAALDDALKALTNEADIATRLKTNLPQEMVVKDGGLMDDLAKSKSLAGADDARTAEKPKAEGSSRSVEETTGKVTKTKKEKIDTPPYDREKILRNIEESKKAREASNFDKYLKEEKKLLEKLNKGAGETKGTHENNYLTDAAEMRPFIITPLDGFDAFLERKYIEIRKMGLEDVSLVAKNTGLSEQDIINMKKHLFLDTHQLSIDGAPYKALYFKADQDVAYAWQLAQKRELTTKEKDWFKQLANHELKEKKLMDSGIPLMDRSTWNGKTFNKDPKKMHMI
jgi:hypothetical protein